MRGLYIFDVDGTLVRPKSGKTFRERPDDWEILPGRVAGVSWLMSVGATVALATNQGGAAFGIFRPWEMQAELIRLAAVLRLSGPRPDAPERHIAACYSHPARKVPELTRASKDRKPGPGMLLQLMDRFDFTPEETLMIGDREEDRGAAEAAGCSFAWADVFFADPGATS